MKIKEPCNEDWAKMKVGLVSRHCAVCSKNVYDFTNKSKEEIILKVLENPNQKTCGRIYPHQLDFKYDEIFILVKKIAKKKPNLAFISLFALTMAVLSCEKDEVINYKERETVLKDTTELKVPLDEIEAQIGRYIEGCEREIIHIPEVLGGDIVIEYPEPPPMPPVAGGIEMEDYDVYSIVEKMPEYKGGVEKMFKDLYADLEESPVSGHGIDGVRVYASFVVEKDGSLTDLRILRNTSGNRDIEREVLQAIHNMPDWIPGEKQGKIVRVKMVLPFRFEKKYVR
jgi:TonB family protein